MKLRLRKKGKQNNMNRVGNTVGVKINNSVLEAENSVAVALSDIAQKEDQYKQGLMQINNQEEKYDDLFEQKLAAQYKEFKSIKDYKLQSVKFIRIMIILVVIMVIALLLITYN
jgi:hypothetical protein